MHSVVIVSATEDASCLCALPAEAAARVRLRDLTGAGHFDLVTPGTPAFEAVFEEFQRLLQ